MTEFIEFAGSFATVWVGLWFLLACLLALVYPWMKDRLLAWHPALASNMLLLLLACPLLLSFSCTLFLFLPMLETALVSSHCHDNCATHVPLVAIPEVALLGLGVVTAILAVFLVQIAKNLRATLRLQKQLLSLAKPDGEYLALADKQAFVFTLGWWKNQIYVTEGLKQHCSEEELAVVLAHEKAHTRRYDNIRLLLATVFTSVLPARISRPFLDDFHLMIESACDFEASERFGELKVAETLLKIQKLSPAQCAIGSTVISTAFTGSEVKQRITALIQGRALSRLQRASFQLSLLLLMAVSLGLVQPLHHGVEYLFALH